MDPYLLDVNLRCVLCRQLVVVAKLSSLVTVNIINKLAAGSCRSAYVQRCFELTANISMLHRRGLQLFSGQGPPS